MWTPSIKSLVLSIFCLAALIVVGTIVSCNKDEIITSIITRAELSSPQSDWTEQERLFFNINNQSSILCTSPILARTNFTPSILVDTYNELVEANELDSFVYSVVPRLGYPVWLSSFFDVSTDSLNYFVYVPFVKPDSNYISAYLVGYKDYSNSSSDLIMNIQTRIELDSIRNAQKDFTSNTCHELMRFFAFDSLLFNNSASEFYDLYCEACLDGTTSGIADPPFVPYCDTIKFELCYYVEDSGIDDTDFEEVGWHVVNNPGSYGGGPSGSFTVIFGGIYSGFSPLTIPSGGSTYTPGDNIGQLLSDIGNAIGNFFGGGFSAIGDFFSGLFAKKNKYRRCPSVGFTSSDEIESRTQVFICSDYVMIRCNNGRWWETVALIPCDGCDLKEELEKEKEKYCKEQARDFVEDNGFIIEINGVETQLQGYKQAFWAATQCCQQELQGVDCAIDEESEFYNWYLEDIDGGMDYQAGGASWDNHNPISTQNLPTLSAFNNGMPRTSDGLHWLTGADNVYPLVGGSVEQARIDDIANGAPYPTTNTCALKISIALNASGVTIPHIWSDDDSDGIKDANEANITIQGADGKYYFLRAEWLVRYCLEVFPEPDTTVTRQSILDGATPQSAFGENQGIYLMLPYTGANWDASGHCDYRYYLEDPSPSYVTAAGYKWNWVGTAYLWTLE